MANKLTLNKSKTEFMIIGSRQRLRSFVHSPSLKIGAAQISQVPSAKSLGIYIVENLTRNVHIENLSKKIASGIAVPKRIRPFVPHRTLQFIYYSLVKSISITVTLSGVTVIKLLPIKSKSYKTVLLES